MSDEIRCQLGCKAILRDDAGWVLLLRARGGGVNRLPYAPWDLPGGRMQWSAVARRGEMAAVDWPAAVQATLEREVAEETGWRGVRAVRLLARALMPLTHRTADGEMVALLQQLYLCEVRQRGPLVLSEEHDRAHWFSPAEAAERLRDRYARELCDAIAALEPPAAHERR